MTATSAKYEPFADFSASDRALAALVLERAEQNGVTAPADQTDSIEQIFGKRP